MYEAIRRDKKRVLFTLNGAKRPFITAPPRDTRHVYYMVYYSFESDMTYFLNRLDVSYM